MTVVHSDSLLELVWQQSMRLKIILYICRRLKLTFCTCRHDSMVESSPFYLVQDKCYIPGGCLLGANCGLKDDSCSGSLQRSWHSWSGSWKMTLELIDFTCSYSFICPYSQHTFVNPFSCFFFPLLRRLFFCSNAQ